MTKQASHPGGAAMPAPLPLLSRETKAPSAMRLRPLALIVSTAALLAACGGDDKGNASSANTGTATRDAQIAAVDELNTLTGNTRNVTVELREGTNMAVAPSPDGQKLAFTAQGALWLVPIAGGNAVRLTGWQLEPTAPVWSPDGNTIVFQNYAPEGNYHLWAVDANGANPRELTTGPFDDREPAWLPDGSGLVFASDRSGDGQYKIWSFKLNGGQYEQITKGNGAESNPIVSPDGKQLAFADTGKLYTVALAGGTPVQAGTGTIPAWNRDGSGLIYQSEAKGLNVGGQDVVSNEDLFPFPVRWLPDGRFVYSADGKIRIRDASGGSRTEVPFTANLTVRRPVISATRDRGFNALGTRQVIGISAPTISPDGNSIAFVALNDVWVMKIGEAPVRLTNDTDRDGNPQWTPDGSAVYFSSEKGNAGALAIDQIDIATRQRTRLASITGKSMVTPKMSPSGDRIAYSTLSGQLELWDVGSKTAQVIIPSVSTQVSTPSWTPDGGKVMVVDNERINNRFREGYNKLRVIDIGSKSAKFYAVAPAPKQIAERDEGAAVLSPDGRKVAFIMDSVLHVMPVKADGSPDGDPKAITSEVADLPSWAGDSSTILYKSGTKLKTIQADGSGGRDIPVSIQWRQAVATGTTIVRAGQLWDGVSGSLRRDVDIVIKDNRISAVRDHQADAERTADKYVDASDLTVMPGMWDPHIHPLTLYQGGQYGQIAALMLAYGITSTQSVAGPIHQSAEIREALEAGNLIGPRLFVSPPLWEGNRLFYNFARTLRTPEIADKEIAKASEFSADFLKSYVRAPIPIMTRIAQAGLNNGIPTGTHMLSPGAATGIGGTTHLSATQRMGYGWSKSVNGITYQDAYDLHAKGDFHLIDTLFSAQALAGQDASIVSDDRFILVPPNFVNGLQTATQPTAVQLDTIRKDAQQQAKVLNAGGLVANGTDSPLVVPGISVHLNLRGAGLVMSNLQALQTITINAAKMSYLDKDLGSVEVGKLADLVAVRGNPLQDLTAAANVEIVVKNGNVYPRAQILAPFKTPAAMAARKKALLAYQQMCRKDPAQCESGMHAD
ncbi:component of the Tol biopolymer transport system [Noviherbaspirillum humi]|uniref:Component of the Tol biopolymer transport system n=1 Tax=Noviherbaspirillum humi TaxID=1688639 RepID=A0A239F4W8_9BURK|nr:amidohydrolase family protein [Noviherbaspirillum humi]SNS51781.1 component of the Tol biopolymer transport system [Noviherbaspirillum humi]